MQTNYLLQNIPNSTLAKLAYEYKTSKTLT